MYRPGTILVSDIHYVTKCSVIKWTGGDGYEIEILTLASDIDDGLWKIGDVKNINISEYKLDETSRVKEILERYED